MSWLARSFASLTASDDDDAGDGAGGRRPGGHAEASPKAAEGGGGGGDGSVAGNAGRGVKEDISELTKTFTRQLWGVASFLAPPPAASPARASSSPSSPSAAGDPRTSDHDTRSDLPDPTVSGESVYSEVGLDTPRIAGIKSDFAEIGGRFRSGISRLSQNMAVEEISKIASSFLQFGADGDEEDAEEEEKEMEYKYGSGGGGAIGVTEEVLTFARNISMHPETWLDFPLFPDDDAADDFDMSDAQQEHALAVEYHVPRLAALRIELCPSHMSEGCFWKIYFVLLHPRLNKHDAELLSTPQIVEARALLLQDLQNRTKSIPDRSLGGASYRKEDSLPGAQVTTSSGFYENTPQRKSSSEEDNPEGDSETEKHPVVSTEIKIIDKSVIEEEMPVQTRDIQSDASKISIEKYEDNGDDWLEEENIEIGGSRVTSIPIGNEDDVSFSDLEEDEEKVPAASKPVASTLNSQATGSKGWVQLSKTPGGSAMDGTSISPETKESNDWSDLDDIDVM